MKAMLLVLLSIPVLVVDGFTATTPLHRRSHAFVSSSSSTQLFPSFGLLLHALPPRGEEGEDEYFSFEPDDSELAKLGDELTDLEDDLGEDEEEESVKVDVPIPLAVGFDKTGFDDDLDIVPEDDNDEDEEEEDIAFDDDDEEDDVIIAEEDIDDFAYEEDEEDEDVRPNSFYEEDEEDDEWEETGEVDEYDYELEDDDDPNYMIQKERIEKSMAMLEKEDLEMMAREKNWEAVAEALEGDEESYEDYNLIANFNAEAVANGEDDIQPLQWSDNVADKVKALLESGNDFVTVNADEVEAMSKSFDESNPDDPYAAAELAIDEDLKAVQKQKETIGAHIDEVDGLISAKYDGTQPRSQFMDINYVAEIGMGSTEDFRHIPENLMDEIKECMTEMGSASYNVTKWLVYDLDFNVTNLMLAACQHSPDAPILFEHWFPQLQVCERYKYARDGNFSFTWEDASKADMEELYTYYRGFGYNEIPKKAPGETGIIDLEELTEDELQMVDFAAWCQEVYNPEWDRKDFDDDTIRDVDNVYSPYFVKPNHPDLPLYSDAKDDIRNWYGEIDMANDGETSPEQAKYRDMVGEEIDYTFIDDKEFTEAFRGHLIVACTGVEEDLDIAEKITIRFEEEFGKQVFVETRVISHALPEDNVFEVWLESYETELLHSKKRASMGALGWADSIKCDEKAIDRLVEKTAFLISDDARYSYRLDMDAILS